MGKQQMGCLVVCAILLGLAACATPAGRTPVQVIDDAAITTQVKAQLYKDNRLKGLAVSVHTLKGTVTLLGAVDTREQMQLAEARARSVGGVVTVNNLLQLKGP
jgi:hyperosmotically inducible protein